MVIGLSHLLTTFGLVFVPFFFEKIDSQKEKQKSLNIRFYIVWLQFKGSEFPRRVFLKFANLFWETFSWNIYTCPIYFENKRQQSLRRTWSRDVVLLLRGNKIQFSHFSLMETNPVIVCRNSAKRRRVSAWPRRAQSRHRAFDGKLAAERLPVWEVKMHRWVDTGK